MGILKKSLYDPSSETILSIYLNLSKTRALRSILKKSVVRTLKLFTLQIILVKTGNRYDVYIWSKDTESGPLLYRPQIWNRYFYDNHQKSRFLTNLLRVVFFHESRGKSGYSEKSLNHPINETILYIYIYISKFDQNKGSEVDFKKVCC